MRSHYSYPARIERDEEGRYQVRFADLPDALTDGADPAEALTEAADCLSAAIASRIIDGEEIPTPSLPTVGQRLVSPDPTIALKAALYAALRRRDMTVADLADLLAMGDWHQAARLIDPRRSTKLTTLMAALDALRCEVEIAVNDDFVPDDAIEQADRPGRRVGSWGEWLVGEAAPESQPARDPKPRNEPRRRSPLLLPVATPGARAQSVPKAERAVAPRGGRSRGKAKPD
jgi:antitoxin HicB